MPRRKPGMPERAGLAAKQAGWISRGPIASAGPPAGGYSR